MKNSDVCDDILTAYPLRDLIPSISGDVGIGSFILGFIYFVSACATIFWIHQQRKSATQGVQGAARNVMLPFYVPLLYLSAFSDTFVGLVVLFVNPDFGSTDWKNSSIFAIAFAFQHLIIESTAFILMQYGCGYQAVINTAVWGVAWAITTFFVYLLTFLDANSTSYAIEAVWNSVLLLFYATLWLMPEKKLFRRSAVIFYARFWTLIRAAGLFSIASVRFGPTSMELVGNCMYDLFVLPVFLIFKPYVLYRSLIIDSQWWQGLEGNAASSHAYSTSTGRTRYEGHPHGGFDAVTSFFQMIGRNIAATFTSIRSFMFGYQPVEVAHRDSDDDEENVKALSRPVRSNRYEAIRGPLLGVEVAFSDAQGLAREVDTMHQQGTIKLLNFAYLKVDQKQKLGAGSFSTVYTGFYKHTPVAIKMLVTLDLNPDVIRRCNNEARILTEVSPHPNVVTIYGLAVMPPSVCLVLEICEFGSLSDVLRGCNIAGHTRPRLELTMADRMFLALGCARGLQALHNYSPSLCHRDIKSFNFLIDSQLNAKIADLDLGDDLGVEESHASAHAQYIYQAHSKLAGPSSASQKSGIYEQFDNRTSLYEQKKVPNYTGTNMTWQAPEVLLGMGYTQMSDIYSLGLVFWEIIAAGRTKKKFTSAQGGSTIDEAYDSVPYSDCKSQQEIREKIVRGIRPSLSGFTPTIPPSSSKSGKAVATSISNTHTTNNNVDSIFMDMIKLCWQAEPAARPGMKEIVSVVEECYLNCLHKYIFETKCIVNPDIVHAEHLRLSFMQQGSAPFRPSTSPMAMSPMLRGLAANREGNPHISHHYANTHSAEFITNLSILKQEPQWAMLDNNTYMSYLILCAKSPFYVLYTNKKFQLTSGFVLLDLLAQEFESLIGANPVNNIQSLSSGSAAGTAQSGQSAPATGSVFLNIDSKGGELRDKLREKLRLVAEFGIVEHIMANMTRQDGREMLCSLHFYPVFHAQEDEDAYYKFPASSQNNLFSDTDSGILDGDGEERGEGEDEEQEGKRAGAEGGDADRDEDDSGEGNGGGSVQRRSTQGSEGREGEEEENGRGSNYYSRPSYPLSSSETLPIPIPGAAEHESPIRMSDSDFMMEDDLLDMIHNESTREGSSLGKFSSKKAFQGSYSYSGSQKMKIGGAGGGNHGGSSSWKDNFMHTLASSFNRLPNLSDIMKDVSGPSAQASGMSSGVGGGGGARGGGGSKANDQLFAAGLSKKKRKKVAYIVVECNPVRG